MQSEGTQKGEGVGRGPGDEGIGIGLGLVHWVQGLYTLQIHTCKEGGVW